MLRFGAAKLQEMTPTEYFMDHEAWARFRTRSRRITGDWILGGLFGLGLGWFSSDIAGANLKPGFLVSVGCVTMFVAIFIRPLCHRDFWRGQFGKSS